VITAIASALLGARLPHRFTLKRVYLSGLVAGLLSMATLVVSQFFTGDQTLAYVLLLLATGLLGAGFGLCVPALNTFAAAFHPDRVDRSVLILNALLGVGTVLAPVLAAIFVGVVGFWQGLPLISAVLLVALIVVSVRLRFGLPRLLRLPDREPRFPGGFGSTRRSRCSTAFARPSTATGLSWT
jgi:MFS family permease